MNAATIPAPLQIWLPAVDPMLSSDVGRRDLRRAQRQWQNETTIWLLPGLEKARRWKTAGRPWSWELALPSEALNRLDVVHVGSNGFIFGQAPGVRFTEPSINSLLTDWLNCLSSGSGIEYYPCPPASPFTVPIFAGEEVHYCDLLIKFDVGSTVEMRAHSCEDQTFRVNWPPLDEGHAAASVSPSAESRKYYGSFVQGETEAPHVLDRWPGSLARLFPYGGGADALQTLAETRKLVQRAADDPVGAAQEAKARASDWQRTGEATVFQSWFMPLLTEQGAKAALFELELQHGRVIGSLEEAADRDDFQDLMASRNPITVCEGVPGLFWTLLAAQLKGGRIRTCQHCGQLLKAHRKTKRYCSKSDNAACHKARRANDRRRQRDSSKAG